MLSPLYSLMQLFQGPHRLILKRHDKCLDYDSWTNKIDKIKDNEKWKQVKVLCKILKCLSRVWGFYIFQIFGHSWEKLQNFIFTFFYLRNFIFFAVKVDGYDVKPGICLYENLRTYPWVDVTSVNFNSKKVLEDKIFGWQDILQFFSWASKAFKYVEFPNSG